MTELAPGIRNGVRAVIVRDGQLLLIRKEYEDGSERHVLPGGSQDSGETLSDALQRECLEEIGTEVTIRGLLYLADFFKPRDTQPITYRQQVEFLMHCEVPQEYVPHNGHRPDKHQASVVWVSAGQLPALNLFPSELLRLFGDLNLKSFPVYLGRILP
jgi:ADP-ribose pyrophosphatase YjhB (NUDIX family)